LEVKSMDANLFWFNDEQWATIVPHNRRTNLDPSGRMIAGF